MKKILILLLWLSPMVFVGCYSFTGASIPADVKSFNVNYFENQADIVVPSLSQTFTEKLRQLIQTQTTLNQDRLQPDVSFEGAITRYETKPMALQGDQTAQDNRLTMTIKVSYIDFKDEKRSWEKDFTRFADYDGDADLSSVETALIEQITDQIAEDVFNKAFVNW